MHFASKHSLNTVNKTQCTESSTEIEQNSPAIGYLVVIRKKGHIVKIFRPQEKHITIGRSSKNSITLPDPRFSRKAVEIILGPIPILRKENNRNNSNDFISIQPGKPYCFRPYTLTLIEPGGIIINRHKNSNWSKKFLLGIVLITMILMVTRPTIPKFEINAKATVYQGYKGSPVISNSENYPDEKIVESDGIIYNSATKIQSKAIPEKTAKSEEISTSKVKIKEETRVFPDKKDMLPKTNQLKNAVEENSRLYCAEIDKAIKKAELSVQKGELEIAYRMLNPLLIHANKDHLKKIIDTLDPYVHILFKKAYMIRYYDIDRSRRILRNIADSGFTILPSYKKAIRALKEMESPSHKITRDIQ